MAEIRQKFTGDDAGLLKMLKDIQEQASSNIQSFEQMGDSQSESSKKAREAFEAQQKSLGGLIDKIEKKIEATKDDKENTDEWKDALKDATSNVNILGVNVTGLVQNLKKKSQQLRAVTTATGGATKAVKALRVALLSLGIGALVVALSSLVTYFTHTQRGVTKLKRFMDQLGVAVNTVKDYMSLFGEAIVKAFSDPKKLLMDFGGLIKDQIVNRFMGALEILGAFGRGLQALLKRDLGGMKQAAQDAFSGFEKYITGTEDGFKKINNGIKNTIDGAKEFGKTMKENWQEAGELADMEDAMREKRRQLMRDETEIQRKINELREEGNKAGIPTERQIELFEEAYKLQDQLAARQQEIAEEEYEILRRKNAINESLHADMDEEVRLETEIGRIQSQRAAASIRLISRIKGLRSQATAQSLAEAKELEAAMQAEIDKANELQKAYIDVVMAIEKRLDQEKIQLLQGRERLAEQRRQAMEEIDLLEQRAKAAALAAGEEYNLAQQFNKLRENTNEIFRRQAEELNKEENPIIDALLPKLDNHGKNAVKKSVKDLAKHWEKEAKDNEKQFTDIKDQIYIWLGITPEEQDAIQKGAKMAIDGIVSSFEAGIDRELAANARLQETLKRQTDILRDELNHQQRLQEQGRSNNVESKEKELQALLDAEQAAIEKQARLEERRQKIQLANNLAMQISNMQTGATALIAQIAKGGLVGVIAGAVALGQLFSLYNTAKQLATSSAGTRMFRGGDPGKVLGRSSGWVAKGGRSDVPGRGRGHRVEDSDLIIGGDEWVTNATTARRQHRFLSMMDTGRLDNYDLAGFFSSPPPVEAFNRMVSMRDRKISSQRRARNEGIMTAAITGRLDTLISVTKNKKERIPLEVYESGWAEFSEGHTRVVRK